ncbi:P-loop containing nucleoside triphosphate hydrolase protein [Thozetella sp. PMI_491]|nr:P-loop containing nucleoside triphosphate hydrolase protein [Thozetella sp. PMI_491]
MDAGSGDDCLYAAAFGFTESCTASEFPTTEYVWIFWLSVATAAAFVALALPRALYVSWRPTIARAPAVLLVAKLGAGAALAGLRLGLLILAVRHGSHQAPRLAASTALDFAASCLLLALSLLEHFRCSRSSVLTCAYLTLSFIYDIARCPSLWAASQHLDVDGNYTAFPGLFTAAVAVELVFLVLESTRRRSWIVWNAEDHSPEETSSILSLGLYSWLNPLLWRGYREPLAMQHLYALDQALSIDTLDAQNPAGSAVESTGTSVWQIVLWLAKPLGWSLLLPVLPRLCLLCFTFAQPFFLQRLLLFLSSQDHDSSTGSGLVAVSILIYTGIAISTALYWYYQERFQSLLRAFLISAIYRKTGSIPHVGEGDSAAVTLMGADVERIYTGLRFLHEVWANMIQIALASWLLHQQLGLAFLAPLIVVLFGFAASFAMSKHAVRFQGAWMARVQARISFTSTILSRIKDLRVSGMTTPAAKLVQHEREDEIRVGERSRSLIAVSASLSQLPSAVAPALAFAFGPHVLDQTHAYTALSLLALLTSPLLVVLQSLPIIAACVACLRRIKVFLIRNERMDQRVTSQPSTIGANKDNVGNGDEGFIVVRGGSFGWSADNNTLKDIDLCLPKSSITFVVGPVASGKSTLCRALLGEVPYVQGDVILGSGKLGYCDQVPFLFNASIRDNIIGFSPFDPARYAEVIEATMLVEDLRNLPRADETTVGTKGVSLSGGQRQRVSLARALYHDADILVLDDVLSALDGSTQKHVCLSLFAPNGLLRRRGTTALVCTHSTKFTPVADYVVGLSSDGTIADQGRFEDLMQDWSRSRRVGLEGDPDPITLFGLLGDEITPVAKEVKWTSKSQAGSQPKKSQLTLVASPTVDTAVYRHWLSTMAPLPLVIYLVLVLGNGFSANFPTIWLKMWSADSVSPTPEHSFAFWIGIYALLGAGGVLCVFPAGLIMLRTAVRLTGTGLHRAAVHTAMHSSLRFLGKTDVGKVLNLFSQDMNIMDTQLPRMVNNMCFCLATAAGQAVVIALSSAWLAISYPLFAALLWGVQEIYLPSSKRLRILDLEAKTPLYTNFLDTLTGLPTIRAFGWFPHRLARNNVLLDDSQRPSYLLAIAQQWLTLTMNIIVALIAAILVALSTQLGSDAGNVGAGLVTLISLGGTLTTIVVAYTGLETSLGAISRLKTFGEETEQEGHEHDDVVPDMQWPTGGRVQMHDVRASYDGTHRILKGLNLVVEPGEKVALCGRTGSGKSSILAILLRLIDPLPGTPTATALPLILIDDLPLNTIDRVTLRERVISASQDAVFLPDGTSFRTNLDPWAAATDTECTAVVQDLGLGSVMQAKGGLDAAINAGELSAGQKQLFSLARAVLRRRVKKRKTSIDGGLLLLDEITSNTDAATGRLVRKLLEDEFGAYTVLMVTHQREMALAFDRVVVVDGGKVVEDGKPGELLQREGGRFKGLMDG